MLSGTISLNKAILYLGDFQSGLHIIFRTKNSQDTLFLEIICDGINSCEFVLLVHNNVHKLSPTLLKNEKQVAIVVKISVVIQQIY
jgi:hypothetical protein